MIIVPKPRTIFLEHMENGILTDPASVSLEDPSGTWGIRELNSQIVAIGPGSVPVRENLGVYTYNIDSLDKRFEFEAYWKVIDTYGNTDYIYGIIPDAIVEGEVINPGEEVPIDQEGVPVDLDGDGVIDAYGYDLFDDRDGYCGQSSHGKGQDGYLDSYDLNGDGFIDQIDVGKPIVGGCVGGGGSGSVHCGGCGGTVGGTCSCASHCIGPNTSNYNGCFDPRGVRIPARRGVGGTRGAFPPDGHPDYPSPRGTPAKDGTFGGTFGYDGVSGFIPSTGGLRSDRSTVKNEKSPGYWNGLPFQDTCAGQIGPKGQCIKSKAYAMTRTMLRDSDGSCYAFSDDDIDMFLEQSLWAFNAKPTFTNFKWDNIQERWIDIITKGATIWALYAQGLIEAGREFVINENGVSFTPPPVSEKLHSYATSLLAHYEKELTEIKQNFKPLPAGIGQFSVLDISPALRRLRHLREKKIF